MIKCDESSNSSDDIRKDNDRLKEELESAKAELSALKLELDEAKSSVTVAECVKENMIELEKAKTVGLGHEMETLRALLTESHQIRSGYEREISDYKSSLKRIEAENQELRIQLKMDADSTILGGGAAVISDVTKSFARKVKSNLQTVIIPSSSLSTLSPISSHQHQQQQHLQQLQDQNLEDGLQKAQEDTEMLKAIVVPLEEQIEALKQKLRETDSLLRDSESLRAKSLLSVPTLAAWLSGQTVDTVLNDLEQRQEQIIDRPDMYVSLLEVRYSLLLTERNEIKELLERERKLTEKYKAQALMTNDKVLSSRREALNGELATATTTTISFNEQEEEGATKVVSAKEWNCLMSDVTRLLNGADETVNAEEVRQLRKELESSRKLASLAEKYKDELNRESVFRKEVESKWNECAEQHKSETEALNCQIRNLDKLLEQIRFNYSTLYEATQKDLRSVTADREKIVAEIKRLQDENDSLIGKHLANSKEFEKDLQNLPERVEDVHRFMLRFREDLIAAKVAKEALEEKLQKEIFVLKDELSVRIRHTKEVEESLKSEIEHLQEQNHVLESYRSEFDNERKRRQEFERRITDLEAIQTENSKLYEEKKELQARISNLQTELDNSMAVQNDFVRLSQSLQISLEEIRQAEKEVRWQHEDDVDVCQNCKTVFGVTKRKHHCRHCGRIFCNDCVSKNVPCGPSRRNAKVCDVCHTLLVSDSAPYFSSEAPQHND